MLFEEVARRLINIEEHEYSLPNDEEKYVAARQSRFNAPEIVEAGARAARPRTVRIARKWYMMQGARLHVNGTVWYRLRAGSNLVPFA